MASIYVEEGMVSDLTKIIASSMWFVLFKVDFSPSVTLQFDALVEADFSGYSRHSVTWGAIFINTDGNAQTDSDQGQFQHNGGATDNDIYGWGLIDNSIPIPQLVHVERYDDAPRPMTQMGNTILLTVSKTQGGCP